MSKKFFIEIGVCDFDTLLPLVESGWDGIFVEPVPFYYNKLPSTVKKEQAAVVGIKTKESLPIVYWDPLSIEKFGKNGEWMKGVSSIDNEYNHFNWNKSYKHLERTVNVQTMTLNELVQKYNVTRIDFLKIDVEGGDWDILKNYSFNPKPTFIKFELKHIRNKFGEVIIEAIKQLLQPLGYIVYFEQNDVYAIC